MRVQEGRPVLTRGVPRGRGIVKGAPRIWHVCRVMRRTAAERLRIRDVRVTGARVIAIVNARVRTGGRQVWVLRAVIRIERRRRNLGILLKRIRRRVPPLQVCNQE